MAFSSHTPSNRAARVFTTLFFTVALGGCAEKYITPGGPAKISLFADPDIRQVLERKPVARFPVNLALVRVQAPGYRHYGYSAHGEGNYSVALASDIETDEHLRRIRSMPQVSQIVRLSGLVVPEKLDSEQKLRLAAARLQADLVLLYTLDTSFYQEGRAEPLSVLTLGLAPNQQVHIATQASALLVDTQTGFVYGAADARATHKQVANLWTSREAVDQSRRKTETDAFNALVGEVEQLWPSVVATHGQRRKE